MTTAVFDITDAGSEPPGLGPGNVIGQSFAFLDVNDRGPVAKGNRAATFIDRRSYEVEILPNRKPTVQFWPSSCLASCFAWSRCC